ncbi:unnamed protein product [Caenorhabditis angaria]|uniref:Uncharacterized protein n=1 Tax=Caenorhabditis angaria TaxID=860376 RepID=A0A9P1IZD7_9PELO|nr:unnamed protein product [Caenorhabditis angaria]
MNPQQEYPPNNYEEGPFLKVFQFFYFFSSTPYQYLNYPPHQLDPFQKNAISSRLEKCQEIINRMHGCRVLPQKAKMEKIFNLLDLMRKFRMIDNTHAYAHNYEKLFEELRACGKFVYDNLYYDFWGPSDEWSDIERLEREGQENGRRWIRIPPMPGLRRDWRELFPNRRRNA